jgi:hypothetical protein
MTNDVIGMGPQDRAEREKFENELQRIIKASDQSGILLRVIGSLAFQLHCPKFGYLQQAMGRAYTDLDFAAYGRQTANIRDFMEKLGYTDNKEVFIVSGGERAIFDRPDIGLHVDVFYEKLNFCHVIRWEGRLEVDSPTIPLAEMVLEKMQIVQINEKDIIDTIMLLREHEIAADDEDHVNAAHVAKLCGAEWGLWRTTTMNLDKVREYLPHLDLDAEDKEVVSQRIAELLSAIDDYPKGTKWKLRAKIGDKKRWYNEVG